ncbi:MAG: hypothetical protein ABI171_10190 [Collimonas sp.]|uniref:hypothetical protein n=1 Tax=Collimonas sp. TaxID=1963772 RepID=UPI003264FEA1
MNAKQLLSIAALLTASGIALAQTPSPAPATQNAGAETAKSVEKKPAQTDGKKSKASAHDHKNDSPKKNIYSGA